MTRGRRMLLFCFWVVAGMVLAVAGMVDDPAAPSTKALLITVPLTLAGFALQGFIIHRLAGWGRSWAVASFATVAACTLVFHLAGAHARPSIWPLTYIVFTLALTVVQTLLLDRRSTGAIAWTLVQLGNMNFMFMFSPSLGAMASAIVKSFLKGIPDGVTLPVFLYNLGGTLVYLGTPNVFEALVIFWVLDRRRNLE